MDPPLDLLPTALFSPSKAAQQRAQAQEWHHVDTWLSTKYQGRSVPAFERNEDTLRALLALSAANEKADEEREMLWGVQKEALAELKIAQEADSKSSTLTKLSKALGAQGDASLDALASVTTALNAPDPSLYSLASTLSTQTQTSQTLAQQLQYLTQLQRALETELLSLRSQLQELRSPAFQPPLSLQRQTLDWNRNTKQLRTKLSEYSDRVANISSSSSGPSTSEVNQLVRREAAVAELRNTIALLRAKVDAYRGLPKDRDAAIQEVKAVEEVLGGLQRKLDSLFEGLVEKG
jgi:HAUS augmin-like complex subunit 1